MSGALPMATGRGGDLPPSRTILAGVAAVALAFALVPVLDRIGRKKLEAAPSDPSDPVDQAKPLTSSARG